MATGNLANHGPVNIAAISAETKATPVVGDKVIILDSEDSNQLKEATLDSLPGGGGGSGTGWAGEVANVAALPTATGSGDVYLVKNSTGFLWAQRKGLYQDNGTWERLSNATFEVLDSEATFSDDGDNTKKMDFELSSITTGNTRTITAPDRDLDLATPTFDYVDSVPSTSVAHSEGRMYYDDTAKTFVAYNDVTDIGMNIGEEFWVKVYNNSGVTIDNGSVVNYGGSMTGGFPHAVLAQADSYNTSNYIIGVATHDISNGSYGYITSQGKAGGIDTSGFSVGSVLYLSDSVAGALTDTAPLIPNFKIVLGGVATSAVDGSVIVNIQGRSRDVIDSGWDGTIVQATSLDITSNGTVITASLERSGGGNLDIIFGEGIFELDTTPAVTATLTAGSDTSPQINYLYIPVSTKVLTASTSSFPNEEYAPIATVLCQSAASIQTDMVYKLHKWTDHLVDSNDNGHIAHINEWIRSQNATWISGVAQTITGGASNITVATTSGVVLQLHDQSYPAFDMNTGSDIYVINNATTPYVKSTNLFDQTDDSTGAALDDHYSLVIWGVASSNSADCKLFCNLPSGSYPNNNADRALDDRSAFNNYSIPSEYRGTGFLIAKVLLLRVGTTITVLDVADLRGQFPSTAAGGSGTAGAVEFSDNTFRIFDESDSTKEIAFQASGITTSTTRTITMADRDLDLDNPIFSTATISPTGNSDGLTANGSGSGSAITIAHAGSGDQIEGNNFNVDSSGNVTVDGDISAVSTSDVDVDLAIGNSVQEWNWRASQTSGSLALRKGASTVLNINSDWVDGRFADWEEAKVTFNPEGFDRNFIIESSTNANFIFGDAGLTRLGIGTGSPDELLHVAGESQFDDTINVIKAGTTGFVMTDTTNGTALLNVGSEFDFRWSKTTGSCIMDFEAKPLDGTSEANYRFGINSGSTGANKMILFAPNGTARQMELRTGGTSYMNRQDGNMVFGSNTAKDSAQVSVYGDIIWTPDTSVTLSTNGDFAVEATSDTSLTFVYRGSDGTTRTANLTLA